MKLRLCALSALSSGIFVACTPYQEAPPQQPTPPTEQGAEDPNAAEAGENGEGGETAGNEEGAPDETPTDPAMNNGPSGAGTTTPPSNSGAPTFEVARPVPGKPGFVFSPFNNKIVDVKGIPSGKLVADPHYPASEKKYFRVP